MAITTGNATDPVTNGVFPFLAMLVVSLLLDASVRPGVAGVRRWPGIGLHLLVMIAAFGSFLAGSGSVPVAAALATALMALFAVASNAKRKMLGEPLIFSDLALLAGVVRHPRFYFTAIPVAQRWMLAVGVAVALAVLVRLFSPHVLPHLAGLGLGLGAVGVLAVLLRSRLLRSLGRDPDITSDLARYGLAATLLLYWWRWRETGDPPPCATLAPDPAAPELIVVVQCESFADPVELTGDARDALPGLASARAQAWQSGNLDVSGFGAYTMRTEYGVLFGRSEAALGFRRYDPFLTAMGEASHALPARLRGAGYHCAFVHPHDLRFYGRDRLMPAVGFDDVIGEGHFETPPVGAGRYVDDRTLGAMLLDRVAAADRPSFIYAVTMENHGPWDSAGARDVSGRLAAYLLHLQSSDALLTDLIAGLSRDGRPALLVFFGDHRPSIPGVTAPGGARHTPYVIVRFDAGGRTVRGDRHVDLSPAALHHAILQCAQPGATDPERLSRSVA